jgi:hypothetical protein
MTEALLPVIGLPIRLRLDYGQPALFRETDIAILTHFIIYYALVLFCVVFRTYIQCVADQEAATNHPWIKLIKQLLDTLQFLPMLLILLTFSLLRAKAVRILLIIYYLLLLIITCTVLII